MCQGCLEGSALNTWGRVEEKQFGGRAAARDQFSFGLIKFVMSVSHICADIKKTAGYVSLEFRVISRVKRSLDTA